MLALFNRRARLPTCHIIRAGAHNWWLLIDGHLACVRILHALRNDPDPAISSIFRPVISASAVRNKDAMNLQTALELGNPNLKQVLVGAGSTFVANTLVPEQLMQWDKNPKNSKLWPLDCCIHPVGIMFMTDAERPIVRQVQLRCPANVTAIGGAETQGATASKARFGKLGGIIVVGHYLLVIDSGNKQLRVANIRRIIYPGGGLLVTTAEQDSSTSETAAGAAGDGSSSTSSSTAVQSNCRTSAVWGTVQLLSPTGGPAQLCKPYAITGPWGSAKVPAQQWRTGSVAGAVVYVSDDSSSGSSSILRITGFQEQHFRAATATAVVRAASSLVASATAKPLRCSQTLQHITGLSLLADKKQLAVVAAGQVWLLRVDDDSSAATVTATVLCSIRGAHRIAANADGALFVSSTELYNIQQLKPASGSTWSQLLRHHTAHSRQQQSHLGDSTANTSSASPTSTAPAVQVSATVYAGPTQPVCGAADGTAGNALLTSPVGLATYHHNVLVCDKGVGLAHQSSSSSQRQGGRAAGVTSKPAACSRQSVRQQQQRRQGQEVQPDEEDCDVAEAGEVTGAVHEAHVQAAFHPSRYSSASTPLLVQPVIQLGDGRMVKYRRGQVVAVVLPPEAASVPLALVELLEDVIYTREGNQDVFIQPSFLGRELEEMACDMHHCKRVDGDVKVDGSNIERAVRLSFGVLKTSRISIWLLFWRLTSGIA